MKKLLIFLLALVASGSAPGAGNVTQEALGAVDYDVRYKLGVLNTKVATATISFEKDQWNGQPAWHSHALIRTTPVFKLFLGSDYTADAYLSRSDLSPLFFVNPFKEGRFEYVYNAKTREIESLAVKGPDKTEATTFPLDGRTMDLLSLIHDLRFRTFPADATPLPMQLLMGGKAYPARIIFQGTDTTAFEGIAAQRILVNLEHGLMENGSGNEIYLWRSTAPDRRILGLEAALSSGTMTCRIR